MEEGKEIDLLDEGKNVLKGVGQFRLAQVGQI